MAVAVLGQLRGGCIPQEEAQNNGERVSLIIVNGIKSLKQNSVIIDRDYWLKVNYSQLRLSPY